MKNNEKSIDELLKLIYAILISITPSKVLSCQSGFAAHRTTLIGGCLTQLTIYHSPFCIHSLARWHLLHSIFSFQLIKAVLTTAQLDYFET